MKEIDTTKQTVTTGFIQSAQKSPAFGWLPGMAFEMGRSKYRVLELPMFEDEDEGNGEDEVTDGFAVVETSPSYGCEVTIVPRKFMSNMIMDIEDAATRGCVLEMLREYHQDETIHARQDFDCDTWRVVNDCQVPFSAYTPTERHALLNALMEAETRRARILKPTLLSALRIGTIVTDIKTKVDFVVASVHGNSTYVVERIASSNPKVVLLTNEGQSILSCGFEVKPIPSNVGMGTRDLLYPWKKGVDVDGPTPVMKEVHSGEAAFGWVPSGDGTKQVAFRNSIDSTPEESEEYFEAVRAAHERELTRGLEQIGLPPNPSEIDKKRMSFLGRWSEEVKEETGLDDE